MARKVTETDIRFAADYVEAKSKETGEVIIDVPKKYQDKIKQHLKEKGLVERTNNTPVVKMDNEGIILFGSNYLWFGGKK